MSNSKEEKKGRTIVKNIFAIKGMSVLIPLLIVGIILTITRDTFLTFDNITNILRQASLYVIMATGMTFVIISGGIDLSQGSIIAFVGIIVAFIMKDGEGSVFLAIVVGLLIGAAIGLINGLGITYLGLPPFIMTLGTMQIFRGFCLVITDAKTITASDEGFRFLGQGSFLKIPIPIYLIVVVVLIASFVLKYTALGGYIYAIGSNEEAARLSGVNVILTKIWVYIISGFCVALAAIVYLARLGAVQPTGGEGYEMDAIAATVIGGTSMAGGEGGILGSALGAVLVMTIKNGMVLLGVSTYYQRVVTGLIIILAVSIDTVRAMRKKQ